MSDSTRKNRGYWNGHSDDYQRIHAPQLNDKELVWGVWARPEAELQFLGDLTGLDVLELGCGGAQWAVFLRERGVRVVGLDQSRQQLHHARAFAAGRGTVVPLVLADAEQLPFAPASFDVVFCDHGAMTFADPRATVPEVARVLRPGGMLAFSITSPLATLCFPNGEDPPGPALLRDYGSLGRMEDGDTVEYCLPHGEWVRLFRSQGLLIEDLVELVHPPDAVTTYSGWDIAWASRWPAENLWKVRKPQV